MSENVNFHKWKIINPTCKMIAQHLSQKIRNSGRQSAHLKALKYRLQTLESAYFESEKIPWDEAIHYIGGKDVKFTHKCIEQVWFKAHSIKPSATIGIKTRALSAYWTFAASVSGITKSNIVSARRRHKTIIKVNIFIRIHHAWNFTEIKGNVFIQLTYIYI